MTKDKVLQIIDSVMNNREIDSIRNAILAIRDQVMDLPDDDRAYDDDRVYTVLALRKTCSFLPEMGIDCSLRDESRYALIDTCYKIDTGLYGAIWYVNEIPEWW